MVFRVENLMTVFQKEITLTPRPRGVFLITGEVISNLPEISDFSCGTVHILLKHTSAALTLNENADPDVRKDLETIFDKLIPENRPYYTHTIEGPDDMPAHAKCSIFGAELTLPVTDGKLNLGTWQGLYLCEFRNHPSCRKLVITIIGKKG